MVWIIICIILLVSFLALLTWMRLRDRRYLQKKTSDVLSENLKKEIESDRQAYLEKKEKFEKAMDKAKGKYRL